MPVKVLIVDDTRTVRYQLKALVSGMGFEVDEAADGAEALEKIREDKPHIVLMDIMMPEMDGIECCRRIKSNPETRDAKVVMVTNKGEYQKVTDAFKARCDDYIMKPIQESELREKLEEISKTVTAILTLRSL